MSEPERQAKIIQQITDALSEAARNVRLTHMRSIQVVARKKQNGKWAISVSTQTHDYEEDSDVRGVY